MEFVVLHCQLRFLVGITISATVQARVVCSDVACRHTTASDAGSLVRYIFEPTS